MLRYHRKGLGVALLPILVAGGVSLAPTSVGSATTNSPSEILTAPLEIELTPDLWAFSTTIRAVVDSASITSRLPFGEAARDLKSIFLGGVVLKKGPLVLLGDVNYADVRLSGHDVPTTIGRIDIGSLWSTLGVGYVFKTDFTVGSHRLQLALQPTVVGLYTSQDVTVKGNGGKTLKDLDANWWTFAVGINASIASGSWAIRFIGDKSAAGHARAARQSALALEYSLQSIRFGNPTLGLGYRYRYDERAYSAESQLSTTLRGPMLYETFHF